MNIQMIPEEARVIACLMEKSITTPDQYPLSLNALTNACNQKSSRDPVMSLSQGEVQRITRVLKEKYLLGIEEGFKNNTEKYTQKFCNTLLGDLKFNSAEYAIVCLTMLRGSHTPGELRTRSARLHVFESNHEVVETLEGLIEKGIAARLPKRLGRQDHEYTHLLYGELESVSEEETLVVQRSHSSSASTSQKNRDEQIVGLEARVKALEVALIGLAEQLGEEVDLGGSQTDDNE